MTTDSETKGIQLLKDVREELTLIRKLLADGSYEANGNEQEGGEWEVEGLYRCPLCDTTKNRNGHSFRSVTSVVRHISALDDDDHAGHSGESWRDAIESTVEGEDSFPCDRCDEVFHHPIDLATHVRNQHVSGNYFGAAGSSRGVGDDRAYEVLSLVESLPPDRVTSAQVNEFVHGNGKAALSSLCRNHGALDREKRDVGRGYEYWLTDTGKEFLSWYEENEANDDP